MYVALEIFIFLAVPNAFPELKVTVLGMTSMMLVWKPLTNAQARGVITQYKIYYKLKNTNNLHVIDVAGTTTEYILTGM